MKTEQEFWDNHLSNYFNVVDGWIVNNYSEIKCYTYNNDNMCIII